MKIVTGYTGQAHVTSQQQADLYKAIIGTQENYVLNIGSKFNYEIVTANLIKIHDGIAVMQGREVSIDFNDYDEAVILNGTQGQNRNDLICIKYTKDSNSGIENAETVVLQGTPTSGTATDPTYVSENIREGGYTSYYPLYRVALNGITLSSVTPLFSVIHGLETLYKEDCRIEGTKTFAEDIIIEQDVLFKDFEEEISMRNLHTTLYPTWGVDTFATWGMYGVLFYSSAIPCHDCINRNIFFIRIEFKSSGGTTYTFDLTNPVEGAEIIKNQNSFSLLSGGRLGSNSSFMNQVSTDKISKITFNAE
ncbi:hypothetical protein [Anaerosacchariphilus polymeriproducens]|uniref:Uncharacterized protein n=1 Tax=Anaerosacchariphilus polymeriproducens TaxID=1812858 RepID=A0A371AT53_9FIRM|nr:hypothetical protein [Anaerosacchariphilus polymeriproducens]RDU22754.1 hypothetical protein DWV06_13375 [Anaerosacchariphilus polymeriproducens]